MKRPVIMALALAFVLTLAGGMNGADFSIVPGERIGALRLGATLTQARMVLITTNDGEVNAETAGDLFFGYCSDRICAWDEWNFGGYHVVAPTKGRVAVIATVIGAYKTAAGIGSDSSWDEVVAAYGRPTYVYKYLFIWENAGGEGRGIAATFREFDGIERVEVIGVYKGRINKE